MADAREEAATACLTLLASIVLLAFAAQPSFIVRAQTPAASQTQTSGQLAAVIEQLRAHPSDASKLNAARLAGFNLIAALRFEDAWSIFSAMLEVAPKDQQALYGGALALFNLRQVGQAEQLARSAVEAAHLSEPSTVEAARVRSDALVLLGVILAVKGDGAGALKAVEQAALLAPASFDAQFALGRARYGTGDVAGAAVAFRRAVSLRPSDAKAIFFLATALEESADYAGALVAYRELLSAHPENAEGYLGLGALLIKSGGEKIEEGIKALQRAVALNGALYEARVTLGRTLIRTGRAAEALEHLKRAAELAPSNPEPHYQLALAYRRLGKTLEAEQESAIVKQIHLTRRGNVDEAGRAPKNQD